MHAEPKSNVFNNFLATADVPGDRKAAVICPIFKKGDPEGVANYRPLSFTSFVCKAFERISKRAVLPHRS